MKRLLLKTQSGYQMAILPIDLQILYGQLEKVSKTVVQQQGAHLQNVLNDEKTAQKLQEKKNAVQETTMTEDGLSAVHERKEGRDQSFGEGKEKNKEQDDQAVENTREIIKDPSLGKNIDISG
jgi:hypothetical protein